MPKYEFRCDDTGKLFEVHMSFAEYDPAKVVSPFTGSSNVTRLIRRVRVVRSDSSRWVSGDEHALADLEDADPQTLGRAMRQLGSQVGEELGSEFHDVVDRLESGQTPEEIEQSLPSSDLA